MSPASHAVTLSDTVIDPGSERHADRATKRKPVKRRAS